MLGHSILVPLDGSPFGRRALPLACEIVRRTEGSLHLVSVQVPWPLTETTPTPSGIMIDAEKTIADDLRRHLDETAESLTDQGFEVTVGLRVGVVDQEILDACEAAGCDLIAMSTHGRGGFERIWLGSVADRVARHAPVPVLLVPGGEADDERGRQSNAETEPAAAPPEDDATIRTLIIPLDGSPFSEQALQPATALGDLFGADYVLFRAVRPRVTVGSPYVAHAVHVEQELLEIERGTAKHDMDQVADGFEEAGFTATVAVAEQAEPVDGLLRLANAEPGTVIAMTTHGRGGLRRAVLGSTADKVLRGSRRPVLLIRPEEADNG